MSINVLPRRFRQRTETPVQEYAPVCRPTTEEASLLFEVIRKLWNACDRRENLLRGAINPLGIQTVNGLFLEINDEDVRLWTPWGEVILTALTESSCPTMMELRTLKLVCEQITTAQLVGLSLTARHSESWHEDRLVGVSWKIFPASQLAAHQLDFGTAKKEWEALFDSI